MMIRRAQLARAASANDAYAESGKPMNLALPDLGFNTEDTTYVAVQRALRAFAVMRGADAARLTMNDLRALPERDRIILNAIAAAWIDGVAVAGRALREAQHETAPYYGDRIPRDDPRKGHERRPGGPRNA